MKLVIEDESGTKSTIPFSGPAITIGRSAEGVTFRLADRNVSRRHARFSLSNGTVWVEDLGSSYGTRVNGERITGKRKIRAGDLVQIGDYDLVLAGQAEVGGAPPLPPAPGEPAAARAQGASGGVAADGRAAVIRLAAIVAAVALVIGAAAGFAVGKLTAPSGSAVSASRAP